MEPAIDDDLPQDPAREPVRRSRRRRYLTVVAWSLAVLVLVVLAGGTAVYLRLNSNISKEDPSRDLSGERPPSFPGVVSLLVIGTDSRVGLGNRYGDAGSVGHADTNLLVRVAADRSNASVISIPRDLMVAVPGCVDKAGAPIPGQARTQFNVSLGQDGRGPGCTMKTVEELTGIRVDHFVMVDFNAVKTISTALGGVEVCAAKQIDDVKSGLHLSPGKHRIAGEKALAFLRTRHGVGYGSDLDRIKLQQDFVASMIRGIRSKGTLTNPARLLGVGTAVTKALTVDDDIASLRTLTGLALDVDKVDGKHITFTTVPVLDSTLPGESGRVVLKQPQARDLFAWVAAGRSLSGGVNPGRTPAPTPGPTPRPSTTATPRPTPTAPVVDGINADTASCVG